MAIAVAGQLLGWLLSVLLARELGVDGFEAYAVASALFILMASIAPLGSEKYALRLLPGLLARGEPGTAHGYVRFAARRTLIVAVASGLAVGAVMAAAEQPLRNAVLVTCLSLPAGALAHLGVEILTAMGQPTRALLLFRLLVPSIALALALLLLPLGLSAAMAVACWGLGWLVAMAAMWLSLKGAVWRAATPQADAAGWRLAARPFLVHRLVAALLAQAGVLALELLGSDSAEVGAYAAAVGTVGLAVVLVTATNRIYGKQMGLLLEAGDAAGLARMHRDRRRWMLPALALFLIAIFAFSAQWLRLFRPEFVEVGILPLRLLAISTAVAMLLALAPTRLKYLGESRLLYRVMAAGALLQLLLLLALVPGWGATGAAAAQLISTLGMYGAMAIKAGRSRARQTHRQKHSSTA
ncbi:lipopolysaccharide biosynthesis protein [Sandaracinobacteroides hominis]|uniref:lipopolysaccharide biosynthesis protein n=1 Tax=Sandaracinobacteroides hominis TaxID=2780086 RepID=UPI0018F28084|nr:polysaccharide biosynthesis C-terminal domain-containing protein [Sandaracinobacteroides hominis]